MPEDRFLHPKLGQSVKVTSLTDFEARIWSNGFLLCADDFGVMPAVPFILQGFNRAFSLRTGDEITAALGRCIEVGLLRGFEHQTQRYVCDPVWQDFQKVRWPRRTNHPCPPADTLQQCSEDTVKLFRANHGGFPKSFRFSSSGRGHRSQANGLRLTAMATANGSGVAEKSPPPIKALLAKHDQLFTEKFKTRPAPYGTKDAAQVKRLLDRYGAEEAEQLLSAFFQSTDTWIAQSGYTIGAFAVSINKLIAQRTGGGRRESPLARFARGGAKK